MGREAGFWRRMGRVEGNCESEFGSAEVECCRNTQEERASRRPQAPCSWRGEVEAREGNLGLVCNTENI